MKLLKNELKINYCKILLDNTKNLARIQPAEQLSMNTKQDINKIKQGISNITKQLANPEISIDKINMLMKENSLLKDQVDDMINELEVEHFLEHGAFGQDPV